MQLNVNISFTDDVVRATVARIEEKLSQMGNQIVDLDAALTQFETASAADDAAAQAATTEIQTAVQAILAKVGPSIDVSAEIARITAAQQKRDATQAQLQAAADAIQSAAGTTPPVPPGP